MKIKLIKKSDKKPYQTTLKLENGLPVTIPDGKIMIYRHQRKPNTYLKNHLEKQHQRFQYNLKVIKADISKYDQTFVNLYRTGFLKINGQTYDLKYIYLEQGMLDKTRKVYLLSTKKPTLNILTNTVITPFTNKNIILFKQSTAFYEIYKNYGETSNNTLIIPDEKLALLVKFLENYQFLQHDKVPETYYLKESS